MVGCLKVSPLNPVLQEWQPQSYALLPRWGFPVDICKYGLCKTQNDLHKHLLAYISTFLCNGD